ncbi:MAG: acyl-CoA dehydrogenase family protein, partial [Beijerinckiaceae bacterium]
MDFTLPPELDDIRRRTRAFIADHVLPLEADRANFDAHENIAPDVLARVQQKARAAGLWSPQSPVAFGGMALPMVGQAAMYEEANRSIFGPVCLNCAAPDDGNMRVLAQVGTPAQKERW